MCRAKATSKATIVAIAGPRVPEANKENKTAPDASIHKTFSKVFLDFGNR